MAQYVWPQTTIDEMKRDPSQAAFLSGSKVNLQNRQYNGNGGDLPDEKIETALAELPSAEAAKIRNVLTSKRFRFNRDSKEVPAGLRFEIPEGAAQFLELAEQI